MTLDSRRLIWASDLDDFFYCNLKVALAREIGDIETPASQFGTAVHEELELGMTALPGIPPSVGTMESAVEHWRKGKAVIFPSPPLKSEALGLSGKPDFLLLWEDGALIAEFKTGSGPPGDSRVFGVPVWNGHAAQLVGYGLILHREFDIEPELRLIYEAERLKVEQERLHALTKAEIKDVLPIVQRGVSIPFTDETIVPVEEALEAIAGWVAGEVHLRKSHESEQRCRSCVYLSSCPESLV